MSSDHELNEFGLLLDQFHAVVREGSNSIEDIFDAEFRRRFSELINRFAEPWTYLTLRTSESSINSAGGRLRLRILDLDPVSRRTGAIRRIRFF